MLGAFRKRGIQDRVKMKSSAASGGLLSPTGDGQILNAGSSEPSCRHDYGFPTPSESPWPKSESALAAKRSARSRVSPGRTRSWPGIGDWSPRSWTAPNTGSIQAALPPEDVGGAHGYREFLDVILDPTHKEYEQYVRWAGGHFIDEFDLRAVNETLSRMQWPVRHRR